VRFSELDGASVGVWGAGREITSFAEALARRLPAARITAVAFDGAAPAELPAELRAHGALPVSGEDALEALGACDVVVRSPGVSVYKPELRALRERGVPVTTATSLWLCEHGSAGVLGVTGTKGKSTTAALAAHLARAAGASVALAGNIGAPALDLLDAEPARLTVLELSSFQIADLRCGPEVALVTSLFREHSDWHGSEEAYRADKLRLLGLEGVRVALVNGRDARLLAQAAQVRGQRGEPQCYGTAEGWDASEAGIARAGTLVLAAGALPLRGEHNALNLAGALAGLEAIGVRVPALPAALEGFAPLAHRLQELTGVGAAGGPTWVDDSISTTPESTLAALASFPRRELVLIAGGQDRGQDYEQLGRRIAALGAAVVGLPSTGPRVVACALAAGLPAERAREARDLAEAVTLARELAARGAHGETVVLLSPAAPSYDHFRDFEERGERFAELARAAS